MRQAFIQRIKAGAKDIAVKKLQPYGLKPSVPDGKMLRRSKRWAEEYKSQKEKVDGAPNPGMLPDLRPSLFHFLAPVDVVEDEDSILRGMRQAL